MVKGLSTVARIWIDEPNVTSQKFALATPIASAVKKYIVAVVKWTTKLRNRAWMTSIFWFR